MTRVPLYSQLVGTIQQEILSGQMTPGQRLPSEAEMAVRFGVSRATLREALHVLDMDGWIVRQHGVGCFVARRPDRILAGLERLESFTETIRRSGYDARDAVIEIAKVTPEDEVRGALKMAEGASAFVIRSLRTADGRPVIYCEDVISPHLVDDLHLLERRRERESLVEFFAKDCGVRIASAFLSITAVPAEGKVCEVLQVASGAPLLLLKGPAHDPASVPLYFSSNYVHTDRFQFTVVRR